MANHYEGSMAAQERKPEEVSSEEAFKDYVHRRLDEAGVPSFPDGPHSKEGCRIGDRLDILINCRDVAVSNLNILRETYRHECIHTHELEVENEELRAKIAEVRKIVS